MFHIHDPNKIPDIHYITGLCGGYPALFLESDGTQWAALCMMGDFTTLQARHITDFNSESFVVLVDRNPLNYLLNAEPSPDSERFLRDFQEKGLWILVVQFLSEGEKFHSIFAVDSSDRVTVRAGPHSGWLVEVAQ